MENYLKESEMSKSTKTSKTCVILRYLLLEAREQEIKEKRAQRGACVFAKKQRRFYGFPPSRHAHSSACVSRGLEDHRSRDNERQNLLQEPLF